MYMNDFCIFYREHTKENSPGEETEEPDEVGGISVSKLWHTMHPTESFERFNDLSVPFGIQRFIYVDEGSRGDNDDDDEHSFMDETAYSKMFYHVAKDLGSGSKKNGTKRRTKKKRG
jgi:hypothetical protein